jgi:uncharacterized protein YggU (UPF0235/DUF167 family)
VVYEVKVFPKSSKVSVRSCTGVGTFYHARTKTQAKESILCVHLTASAKDNKANIQLLKVLSKYWNIPVSCIKIKKGKENRFKLIDVKCG